MIPSREREKRRCFKDYPSIGQISSKLSEKNVNIIFAVTQSQLALYQTLTELIDGAVVGELKQNSSNIVTLISQNYAVTFPHSPPIFVCKPCRESLENHLIRDDDGLQWLARWVDCEVHTWLSRVSCAKTDVSDAHRLLLLEVKETNPNAQWTWAAS